MAWLGIAVSTNYDWGKIRRDACDHFGEPPGAALEDRILRIFHAKPRIVVDAIENVEQRYDHGRVRSPWPVIAKRAEDEHQRQERALALVVTDTGHDEREARAERYVRSVGYLYPTGAELLGALYGRGGVFASDPHDELVDRRLLELWQQLRPLGQQVEHDHLRRAERWRIAHQTEATPITKGTDP